MRDEARGLALDWPFARQCARASDLEDLRDLLQVELAHLGFRYFCCCSHVRPDKPAPGAVYLHNYPEAWVRHYNRKRLFERDPIFIIGRNLSLPFLWGDPRFGALLEPDQVLIMEEAARHGILNGVTIPLNGPGRHPGSCSLVSERAIIDPDRVFLAQRFAAYAFDAAHAFVGPVQTRPQILLPRRERQCLELVALGKDDAAIAIILGIRRETVRRYVESAKQRLGVTKRPQAVAQAIYSGAIAIEDLFGT